MATRVLKNAHLTVNSVDLSDEVQQIALNLTTDTPEDTAMGDNARSYLPGLNNATFTVTFNSDYTTGNGDATLWTIYSGAAAVTFALRPDAGATSTSNPEYTGSVILTDFGPVDGSVGDLATTAATFQVTGDVSRATS